ncbi:MAG: NAD(P)-dependent oxidoreductase [archaeon]
MKVYFLSPNRKQLIFPEAEARLAGLDVHFEEKKKKPLEKVKGLLSPGEKILALDPDFCSWNFPKRELEKIPDLKAICLQTTSFSWVDCSAAKERGTPVINVRNYSTDSVAEWAVLMALMVGRKIPLVLKDKLKRNIARHKGFGTDGKVAGIIGLGHIGKRIAELCLGLGMDVIYWSRASRDSRFRLAGGLAEIFETADFIFPALAKNEESAKLITDDFLKRMKGTAIFTSIVHAVYNEKLLLRLAEAGKIGGYAFEFEPGEEKKFSKLSGNILALPGLAWATDSSFRRNGEIWVENILKAAKGDFSGRIN